MQSDTQSKPSYDWRAVGPLLLIAISHIALTFIGVYRHFSVIPFNDTWDGDLDFVMKVTDGQYTQWWDLYYEHRIIWARIIFWFDHVWFNSGQVLPVVCNLVTCGLIGLMFFLYIRKCINGLIRTCL